MLYWQDVKRLMAKAWESGANSISLRVRTCGMKSLLSMDANGKTTIVDSEETSLDCSDMRDLEYEYKFVNDGFTAELTGTIARPHLIVSRI